MMFATMMVASAARVVLPGSVVSSLLSVEVVILTNQSVHLPVGGHCLASHPM
jgi:hypothetical protein